MLVPEAGLEPARSKEQQIFILHYVTIATCVLQSGLCLSHILRLRLFLYSLYTFTTIKLIQLGVVPVGYSPNQGTFTPKLSYSSAQIIKVCGVCHSTTRAQNTGFVFRLRVRLPTESIKYNTVSVLLYGVRAYKSRQEHPTYIPHTLCG